MGAAREGVERAFWAVATPARWAWTCILVAADILSLDKANELQPNTPSAAQLVLFG